MNHREYIFRLNFLPLYKDLYRVALSVTRSEADASDIVQEVMVKVWNYESSLDEIQNPRAFTMRLLRNLIADHLRKISPESTQLPDYDRAESLPEPDTADFLIRIIGTLPTAQQEVIRLNAFGGLSTDEISDTTGFSPANVRQLLSRARRQIRILYNKYMS